MSRIFTNGVGLAVNALNGNELFPSDFNDGSQAAVSSQQLGNFAWGQAKSPNGLIGGDFGQNLWQRGTTSGSISSTLTYGPDRWWGLGGASSALVLSKAGAPAGFTAGCQVQRKSGNTDTSQLLFGQVLTTQDSLLLAGAVLELQFWLAAGVDWTSSVLEVLVGTGTGTDQSAASFAAGSWPGFFSQIQTVPLAPSQAFALQSLFFPIPASATQIGVEFQYTPSGTAGANDWFALAGCQLGINPTGVPGPSLRRLAELEAQLQLAFYYRLAETNGGIAAMGLVPGANKQLAGVEFPTWLRAVPTFSATVGGLKWSLGGANSSPVSLAMAAATQARASISDTATATAGEATALIGTGTTGFLEFSAEL